MKISYLWHVASVKLGIVLGNVDVEDDVTIVCNSFYCHAAKLNSRKHAHTHAHHTNNGL